MDEAALWDAGCAPEDPEAERRVARLHVLLMRAHAQVRSSYSRDTAEIRPR